jgi:uncharacterized protein (TIGR02246 family)
MMRVRWIASILAVALAVVGVGIVSAQPPAVKAAIEAGNKAFGAAVAKGDAAAIGNLYTLDAQALPPGSDAVTGREAIQKMWAGVLVSGIAGAVLTTVEIETMGDLAAEVGTYVLSLKDGKAADHGKYVVVWKKVNGQWKLHRDIWNSSVAPAPAK